MTTSLLLAGIVYLSKRVKGDIDTLGLLLQPAMSLNVKSKQKDMCACKTCLQNASAGLADFFPTG